MTDSPRADDVSPALPAAGASAHVRAPLPASLLRLAGLGLLRWGLVTILLATAVWKLVALDAFERHLWSMGFFPDWSIPLIAPATPALEIAAAALLALPALESAGILLTLFLSSAFAGFHPYLYYNGIVVPCGCAGIREEPGAQASHLLLMLVCVGMFLAAGVLSAFPSVRQRQTPAP